MVPFEKQMLSSTAEAVLPVGEVLARIQALAGLRLLDLGPHLHLPHHAADQKAWEEVL